MVNGVRGASLDDMRLGGLYTVDHTQVNKKKHIFTIKTGIKEAIVVKTFKDMVSVNVESASAANFGTVTGLMGNLEGVLLARDGVTVMDDHDLFGQEWQVQEGEGELFESPSLYKEKCVAPSTIKQSRRLGEATVSEEAATVACAHIESEQKRDMCVFDVMAMADLQVADVHGAY